MHGKLASFMRGIYFIRFPFSLSLILFSLGFLDRFTGLASFTRGILTPESESQAGTAAFMVFSVGMIILLLVRIIALNGDERFETACWDKDGRLAPVQTSWLHQHLGSRDMSLGLFVAAHFPGAVLLYFVVRNVFDEVAAGPAKTTKFLVALMGGIVAAYMFWLFVGLINYWTFDSDSKNPVPREVIFPRRLVPLSDAGISQ